MVGEIRALLIKKGYLLFMKQFYINSIRKNINSLNVDQLYTLFHVYLQLDSLCDFFMSEESHIQFINSYYNVSSIRHPEIFKTFMNFSIIRYTSETRYTDVLFAIDMINENCPFEEIIYTLYYRNKLIKMSS